MVMYYFAIVLGVPCLVLLRWHPIAAVPRCGAETGVEK